LKKRSSTLRNCLLGTVALLIAALLLPLSIGIWLPDVFVGRQSILAESKIDSSITFRVVQYWNHVDFYTTELHILHPSGSLEKRNLDDDDDKTWSVPLVIDPRQRTATITLKGNRVRTVHW
jgi:hypothetical protein